MNGVELITAERQRQIEAEGWTPEHDDEHIFGQLCEAAVCYAHYTWQRLAYPKAPPLSPESFTSQPGRLWPWNPSWWKPSIDPIRNLVKAGALIAAEIDRLQRAKQCCSRDDDYDGNCDIHSARGVLRRKA
jgi:hypothetical protein